VGTAALIARPCEELPDPWFIPYSPKYPVAGSAVLGRGTGPGISLAASLRFVVERLFSPVVLTEEDDATAARAKFEGEGERASEREDEEELCPAPASDDQ